MEQVGGGGGGRREGEGSGELQHRGQLLALAVGTALLTVPRWGARSEGRLLLTGFLGERKHEGQTENWL